MLKVDPKAVVVAVAFVAPRAPGQYDADKVSQETGLRCLDPSLAKQEFKEEVDINTLVKRFGLDGPMPQGVRQPMYGDFTASGDFRELMNGIAEANESFDQMPARVRSRFHNKVEEFVEFCLDEKNRKEVEEMGLVRPDVLEARAKADAAAKAVADAAAKRLAELEAQAQVKG